MGFLDKVFGSYSDRELKKNRGIVNAVLALDESVSKLTDDELKAKTIEFKKKLAEGATLDDILVEAFAILREAAWRVLGMKHFPVQIEGGLILHQGRIAEMKTGEGKTLVATLPAYLNGLTGLGVHVVTVNDYLAKRDKEWMGKLYEFLGLSVGCIVHGLNNEERRAAYASDIVYGTNNEFGFDYLRDNMVVYKEEMVQRDLFYAIVDEVDSILVDEARTPLIISGKGDKSTDLYKRANDFVKTLSHRKRDPNEPKQDIFNREVEEETVDYVISEKEKTCAITENGTTKAEKWFGIENLSDSENMEVAHHVNQAMKAISTMKRDTDYVVKDGEIIIVDEFTGRLMYGRRYSDGLHQAIEAKEGVYVRSESKTLATITFQNYFRMYKKLSGMTGTAKTEEEEFDQIYNMDVIEIPTNKDVIRIDHPDVVYKTEVGKFKAVIEDIKERYKKGQPILVGTISIEKSELLSKLLKKDGINHEVLNAKQHDREAEIVAQAGKYGSVTIATNMAGRGTDIVLGGNPDSMAKNELKKMGYEPEIITYVDGFYKTEDEKILEARKDFKILYDKYKAEVDINAKKVVEAGGLHIIGTERHESRRIDNQLRGRAGRQGDPGSSKFFLSLEDDLMRLFGGERMQNIASTFNMPEDEPIEAGMLTKLIENSQRKVEGNNFGIRKYVIKYDDVMNQQRNVIYKQRRKVLEGENLSGEIRNMREGLIRSAITIRTGGSEDSDEWNLEGIDEYVSGLFNVKDSILKSIGEKKFNIDSLTEELMKVGDAIYAIKEEEFGAEKFREVERIILLQVVDSKWMDHIDSMDQFRTGIGLRAYGQRDPVLAYQNEGSIMFDEMSESIQEDTVKFLYAVQNPEKLKRKRVAEPTMVSGSNPDEPYVRKAKKVGRNDDCPCGSGKKYKRCCGR